MRGFIENSCICNIAYILNFIVNDRSLVFKYEIIAYVPLLIMPHPTHNLLLFIYGPKGITSMKFCPLYVFG